MNDNNKMRLTKQCNETMEELNKVAINTPSTLAGPDHVAISTIFMYKGSCKLPSREN